MGTSLQKGDKAPDFKTVDQHNNTISLAALKGQKVVLYFYPEDDTPGCTAQACNLRDNMDMLKAKGYIILGCSPDGVESHQRFVEKFNLNFSLLADEDKTICNAYGVYGEKNVYGNIVIGIARTTFLIDENGIITDVIKKVHTETHTDQILNKVHED